MSAEDHDKKNNDAHDDILDTPGVIAHPPLIYAGGLSAGQLASYFLPVTFLPRPVARVLGWLLIGSGLILDFLGDRALRNAGTNINPRHRLRAEDRHTLEEANQGARLR